MKIWSGLMKVCLLVSVLVLFAGCCHHHRGPSDCGGCCKKMAAQGAPCCAKPGMAAAMPMTMAKGDVPASERKDVLYTCACGPDCKCNTISKEPGLCACGKPLAWGHVIRVEGDEALLCTCAEGCACALDPNDPTKCGCGEPVKRVSLKGSGLFFCNCGGACGCNTVGTTPGECKCGMALKQVN